MLWLAAGLSGRASIVISEFMPDDASLLADEDGDYPGWIELHNRGAQPVALQHHGLSDDGSEPFKWRFPAIEIGPDQRLVVFASGKDRIATPVPPAPDPAWLPAQLSGLLLWLDAAAVGTLETEAGAVVRWQDRTGRPYEDPEPPPRVPNELPGLVLWLDADAAATLDWKSAGALRWRDQSGHGLEAKSPRAGASPVWTAGAGERRRLRFDGSDDYLELAPVTDICTVVWVAREGADAGRFAALLGDRMTYSFHSGESQALLHSTHAPGWRGWFDGVEVDPYCAAAPSRLAVVALTSANGGKLSLVGSDRLLPGRFWAGELAELACYNRVLTDTERAGVENYLRARWQIPRPPRPLNYAAVQEEPDHRPRVVCDPLSGLPALRLDGEDDHLCFPRLKAIRSVFWVARERPVPDGSHPGVLGDAICCPFHRGEAGRIYHHLWAAGAVRDGPTRMDGSAVTATLTRLPERRVMLATGTAEPVPLGLVGADRLLEGHYWGGDIHEVLLFDRTLLAAEVAQVEAYLRAKWRLPERHLHTGFESRASGKGLVLTDPDGHTLDVIAPVVVPSHVSYARVEFRGAGFGFCTEPTPGQPNRTLLFAGLTGPPRVSPPGGFFAGKVQVTLSAPNGAVIRYSLDGSLPREGPARGVMLYQRPFLLKTGAVVRARAFLAGHVPSVGVSVPYLPGPKPALPVVSLVVEPGDLWSDQRGIYATGPHASPDPPYWGANFHQAWERAAEFSFLGTNGVPAYHAGAGIRIHGSWSRSAPQKSFRLYARRRYGGGEFAYPFFPGEAVDRFEVLLLRNTGNDWSHARLRDRLSQSLGAELGLDHARSRPVEVHLNGAYWGHYDLMERADEHFIASHHGVDCEALDIVENGSQLPAGDPREYARLCADCLKLAPGNRTHFESVAGRLEVDSLLDYHITEIVLDNSDWPTHNTTLWRPRRLDGQWRWILNDLDGTFDINGDGVERPTLRIALGLVPEVAATYPPVVFLPQLLAAPDFRAVFLNRVADALSSVFETRHVLDHIDRLAGELEPGIPRHLERWRREATGAWPVPPSLSAWRSEVERLRAFARARPAEVYRQMREHFGLAGEVRLRVQVNDPGWGRVRVNSVCLPAGLGAWEGGYFQGVPLEVEALPAAGCSFVGWEGLGGAPALIRLTPGENLDLRGVFRPGRDPGQVRPAPFELWQGEYRFGSLPEATPAGAYPPGMTVLQTRVRDPGLDAVFDTEWVWPFNLASRSRVVGLGERGLSFLNTSNPQAEPGAGYLGAVVLTLGAASMHNLQVAWIGGTVTPNNRHYGIRLQCRTGTSGPFLDVLDDKGQPVEYRRNPVAGHFSRLGPTRLPGVLDREPVVQLRWVYHRLASSPADGSRDELRLDDIRVWGERTAPVLVLRRDEPPAGVGSRCLGHNAAEVGSRARAT